MISGKDVSNLATVHRYARHTNDDNPPAWLDGCYMKVVSGCFVIGNEFS